MPLGGLDKPGGETERGKRRLHLGFEIGPQDIAPGGILAFGGVRHPAAKFAEKVSAIKVAMNPLDSFGSAHDEDVPACAGRRAIEPTPPGPRLILWLPQQPFSQAGFLTSGLGSPVNLSRFGILIALSVLASRVASDGSRPFRLRI